MEDRHEQSSADPHRDASEIDTAEVGTAATASASGTPRPQSSDERSVTEKAAAPVGGVGGALAGATVGTLSLGPIGTAIGAIAGAVGGWWAGHGVAESAPMSAADERYYQSHYEEGGAAPADRAFEHARPAYHLGHIAARNPDYRGRNFEAVEPELQHGWTDELQRRYGNWAAVRDYARAAYVRGGDGASDPLADRSGLGMATPGGSGTWSRSMAGEPTGYLNPEIGADLGGTASHERASFNDPVADTPDGVVERGLPSQTGHGVQSSGSPVWVRQPVDQGGGGSRLGDRTSAEPRTDALADEPSAGWDRRDPPGPDQVGRPNTTTERQERGSASPPESRP